jgi:chaperonin GroEL (HSP60 family)
MYGNMYSGSTHLHTHTHTHNTGNNPEVGKLISDAMTKVGRQGVVTMEESRTAEDNLFFVEGMQVGVEARRAWTCV